MSLFDLTGPLAAAMGIGVVWGTAHASREPTTVLGLAVASSLIAALALILAARHWAKRRPPQSEAHAVVVLAVTAGGVLAGAILAGGGALSLAHHGL